MAFAYRFRSKQVPRVGLRHLISSFGGESGPFLCRYRFQTHVQNQSVRKACSEWIYHAIDRVMNVALFPVEGKVHLQQNKWQDVEFPSSDESAPIPLAFVFHLARSMGRFDLKK